MGPSPTAPNRRLPWLIAAVCAVLLVATVVFAVVVLSGGSDNASTGTTTTYRPGTPIGQQPLKYKPGKVANSCDALDLSAIEKLGFRADKAPVHQETNAGTDGELECQASFENAALTGQANYGWSTDDREVFDEGKTSAINTPPDHATAGAIAGLGGSAYFTVEDQSSGSNTYLKATVEMLDDNLFIRITFDVRGTGLHTTREDVRKAAENQARVMLDRLR